MKKKRLVGFTYLIVILTIFGTMYYMITQNKIPKQNSSDNQEKKVEQNEKQGTEAQYWDVLDDLKYAETNAEYHSGEHKKFTYGDEVNTEFITNGYTLREPLDGYELEFLLYEELPDITDYLYSGGIMKSVFERYIDHGVLNKDGTLNSIKYKYTELLGEQLYGDEFAIDNYEFIAVKLGVKIKNTENRLNEIHTYEFLSIHSLVCLDDGKMYEKSSLYAHDFPDSIYTYPVYHSFIDYVSTDSGYELNTFSPNMDEEEDEIGKIYKEPYVLTLEPFEEIEGEIIYLLGKQHLNDIYFAVSPNNDFFNFNGIYITFLPLKNLMNLPSE